VPQRDRRGWGKERRLDHWDSSDRKNIDIKINRVGKRKRYFGSFRMEPDCRKEDLQGVLPGRRADTSLS